MNLVTSSPITTTQRRATSVYQASHAPSGLVQRSRGLSNGPSVESLNDCKNSLLLKKASQDQAHTASAVEVRVGIRYGGAAKVGLVAADAAVDGTPEWGPLRNCNLIVLGLRCPRPIMAPCCCFFPMVKR